MYLKKELSKNLVTKSGLFHAICYIFHAGCLKFFRQFVDFSTLHIRAVDDPGQEDTERSKVNFKDKRVAKCKFRILCLSLFFSNLEHPKFQRGQLSICVYKTYAAGVCT